jgi:hypothetical protein
MTSQQLELITRRCLTLRAARFNVLNDVVLVWRHSLAGTHRHEDLGFQLGRERRVSFEPVPMNVSQHPFGLSSRMQFRCTRFRCTLYSGSFCEGRPWLL